MSAEINLYNEDCLPAMKAMKDKQFNLAIVDPPYGIGVNKMTLGNGKKKIYRGQADWDKVRPTKEYFDELKRISKNQIVWGGNYFTDFLPPARCYIVWDKKTGDNNYADCELALTNIDAIAKIYTKFWLGVHAKDECERIHPTQKPINLYKFLLQNFAKPGDKILDTHLGSGSIAVACWDMGFDLTAYEIDKEYYDKACKRFDLHRRQGTLW